MNDTVVITAHGALRMSQRGIGASDIDMILLIGTKVEGGYLVREKDFQDYERELKHDRDRARKLVGKRLVVERDQVVVTAYLAERGKQRRLLRGARDRDLG
jgi:Domain of unknown function (DUF4258)